MLQKWRITYIVFAKHIIGLFFYFFFFFFFFFFSVYFILFQTDKNIIKIFSIWITKNIKIVLIRAITLYWSERKHAYIILNPLNPTFI